MELDRVLIPKLYLSLLPTVVCYPWFVFEKIDGGESLLFSPVFSGVVESSWPNVLLVVDLFVNYFSGSLSSKSRC